MALYGRGGEPTPGDNYPISSVQVYEFVRKNRLTVPSDSFRDRGI